MSSKQRGSIIDRGPNKHLLRVFLGRDGRTGKRMYSSKTFEGTISAAKKELTTMLGSVDEKTFIVPKKQTVQAFVTAWLKDRSDLSAGAKYDYQDRMEKDIYPFIGGLQLSQLSPQHMRMVYGKLQTERKLSARTIQYTHTVFSQAMSVAVEDGRLLKNPCLNKSVADARPSVKKEKVPVLTQMEMVAVLAAETDKKYHAMWFVMLMTGLRPQEAGALKWEDLEDDRLIISRARHRMAPVSDTLKTDAAYRTIHLDADTLQVLQQYRATQAKEILKAGSTYVRDDYIFASSTGATISSSTVYRYWRDALATAGLSHRKLYVTRHSHASHLIDMGENVKAVSERMGHSDPAMTLRVYTHTLPETDKRLATAAQGMLRLEKKA